MGERNDEWGGGGDDVNRAWLLVIVYLWWTQDNNIASGIPGNSVEEEILLNNMQIEHATELNIITMQMLVDSLHSFHNSFKNTTAPAVSSSGLSDSANITNTFLAKFKPADVTHVEPSGGDKTHSAPGSAPLFQGSLSFQPFRKDAAKQARYDTYLASLKQGISGW